MFASKNILDFHVGNWIPSKNHGIFGRVISMCKYFQESVKDLSLDYYNTLRRHNYVTPTSYLELILTFKTLLNSKRLEVDTIRNRYLTGLQKLDFAASQVSTSPKEEGRRARIQQKWQGLAQVLQLRAPDKDRIKSAFVQLSLLASFESWSCKILSLFIILIFCPSYFWGVDFDFLKYCNEALFILSTEYFVFP